MIVKHVLLKVLWISIRKHQHRPPHTHLIPWKHLAPGQVNTNIKTDGMDYQHLCHCDETLTTRLELVMLGKCYNNSLLADNMGRGEEAL